MGKNYNISLIKGDGIGVEIVNEAVKVLEAVGKPKNHAKRRSKIEIIEICNITSLLHVKPS